MVLSPAAESELLAQHTPLVLHLAKRYINRGVSREDLIQEGLMALVEAVRSFDSNKPMKLSSWIGLLASHAMLDAVRAVRYRPMQRLGEKSAFVIDHYGDRADDGDVWDALQSVRGDLKNREARLFWAWLGLNSQEPLVLTSLCRRYRLDMQRVLTVIGLGIRSCHDRLGLDARESSSCLN